MTTNVTNNSNTQEGSSTLPARQLGPSQKYIKEIFKKFAEENQMPGYGTQAAYSIASDLTNCYLNDLHPDYIIPDDKNLFKCPPEAIVALQTGVQTIDKIEVAKRGGLPDEWLVPMLARRHGVVCQQEVANVLNLAFKVEEECVYVDGYPAKNKADIETGDPQAKIYTDEEVNELRDLYFWAVQTDTVDPALQALVSNQQNIRQSTVKGIAVATLKILNQK